MTDPKVQHQTVILDGRKTAREIKTEIAEEVRHLKSKGYRGPHLAAILVGDDGASETYVNNKVKGCKQVGFDSTLLRFSTSISESKLLHEIERINNDDDIDGLVVQLPLPEHISEEKVNDAISPSTDVDGFTNENYGRLVSHDISILPATPYGIMELLRRYNIKTKGKHCVVVGQSRIVGSPVASMMAKHARSTVTLCHIDTIDLPFYTRQADILIVAVGKPGLISGDMVKEGVVVVDVGTTRVSDEEAPRGYVIKGDVIYDEVAPRASHISPVPGGVGPMTIASLLLNTLKASKQRLNIHI